MSRRKPNFTYRLRPDLVTKVNKVKRENPGVLPPKLVIELSASAPRTPFVAAKFSNNYNVYARNLHFGQRKLFMAELEHLVEVMENYDDYVLVIYIGSAPNNKAFKHFDYFPNLKFIMIDPNLSNFFTKTAGSHFFETEPDEEQKQVVYLKYLSDNFKKIAGKQPTNSGIQFFNGIEVVNVPNKYSTRSDLDFMNQATIDFIINSNHKLYVIEDYFMNDTAKFIKDLFDQTPGVPKVVWSDMRSSNDDDGIVIDHVRCYNWLRIMQPDHAMLKFRCPFGTKIDSSGPEYEQAKNDGLDMTAIGKFMPYFEGKVVTQCWQPRSSAETRLYVSGDTIKNNTLTDYDRLMYEEILCYYNEFERVYREHDNPDANPKIGLGKCGDCAIEAAIWRSYIEKFGSNMSVGDMVKDLSKALGKSLVFTMHDGL